MMTTIEQIARKAGVGRSTVSRVMNEDPRVSDQTRERVLTVLREENYQPNFAARTLASGRSDIIGAVVPMALPSVFGDPFFPRFLEGVAGACEASDSLLMLWLAPPEDEQRNISKVLGRGPVDGLVIAAHVMHDPLVEALHRAGKKFVLSSRYEGDDVSYVCIDNRISAKTAVTHLLRCGRTRIAHITGPHRMLDAEDRLAGYTEALRDFGIAFDETLVGEGDWSEPTGYAAMRRLIATGADAVFAGNDAMALGAMRALKEEGIRIPEDVAIVGFDDIPAASAAEPSLTTVRQPVRRLGEVATTTLLELISNPDGPPRRTVLPTELVIRASSGGNRT